MTPDAALLLLISELRINMADADAQRDAALAEVARLRERVAELERDGTPVGAI